MAVDSNHDLPASSGEPAKVEEIKRLSSEEQAAIEQQTGQRARNARFRASQKSKGFVSNSFWFPKEDRERVKALIQWLSDNPDLPRDVLDGLVDGGARK